MYVYYSTKEKEISCAKLSIPLLIRMLEYAYEDAASDVDLHWIVERVMQHCKDGEMLTMEHYTELIPEDRLVTVEVKPGQKIEVEPINE